MASNTAPRWRRRLGYFVDQTLVYLFVAGLVTAILGPYLWMVISSISTQSELLSVPPHWIPTEPTFQRYTALILGPQPGQNLPVATDKFIGALLSSTVVSALTTLACIVFGSAAAYALTRLPFPGRRYFMIGVLGLQMLPIVVIIIPLYIFIQKLGLTDTWRGLILMYTGFLLPTVIWIMRGYFQTIPRELEEAALIDGCTRLGALVRVVLPISGPGLVAIASFAFLSAWNEFFMALIFSTNHAKTITVIVTEFSTQFGIDYGLMTTGGVIGSLLPIVLAFALQRYIVQGLTAGAVKA